MIILKEGRFRGRDESTILPLGPVDLITGKSKLFNIYETWDDTTAEFWQATDNGYPAKTTVKLVFTSGNRPTKDKGGFSEFVHDQTSKFMFTGTLIDFCSIQDLPKHLKYGKKLLGYVYK